MTSLKWFGVKIASCLNLVWMAIGVGAITGITKRVKPGSAMNGKEGDGMIKTIVDICGAILMLCIGVAIVILAIGFYKYMKRG